MKINLKRALLTGTTIAAVVAFAPVKSVHAATATLDGVAADDKWAESGTHTQATAKARDALAGDNVNLNGLTLTVTNDGTANDISGVNTFVLGNIGDTIGAGNVSIVQGASATGIFSVTIAAVGAATQPTNFSITNLNGNNNNTTVGVTGALHLLGTLGVTNVEAANGSTVAMTVGGAATIGGVTTITGGTFAGSSGTLTLNGAGANTFTGGIVLNDQTGGANLILGGSAAQTVNGTIDGFGNNQGTLTVNNSFAGTDVTFANAVGATHALLTINLNDANTTAFSSTVNADFINFGAAGTATFAGNVTATTLDFVGHNGVATFASGANFAGNAIDTGGGAGTVNFTGNETFTGNLGTVPANLLAINFNGGGGTVVTVSGTTDAATVTTGAGAETFAGLVTAPTFSAGTGTEAFNGGLTGNLNFTGAGGTATLANAQTLTGNVTNTTINSGTLDVGGAAGSTVTGTVGVGGGGRLLAVNVTGAGLSAFDAAVAATSVNVTGTGGATFVNTVAGTVNLTGAGSTTTLDASLTGGINFGAGASAATTAVLADNVNISTTVNNTTGGNSIGTLTLNGPTGHTITGAVGASNSLNTINVNGTGATSFASTVNADNINYHAAGTLNFAQSVTSDGIDFLGAAGTANFADGANFAGNIISTGGPSGTVNFAGTSNVTAIGLETGSLGTPGFGISAVDITGAAGKTVTVAGTIVATNIGINGTGDLTADGNVTGAVNFGADGVFNVGDGVTVTGNITNTTINQGTLNITDTGGGTIINGTVGIGGGGELLAVNMTGAGGVVTFANDVAAETVGFGGAGSTANLNGNLTSGGALTVAGTINIAAGKTLTAASYVPSTGTLGTILTSTGSANTIGNLVSTGSTVSLAGETVNVNVPGAGPIAIGSSHAVILATGNAAEIAADDPTTITDNAASFYKFTVTPGTGLTADDLLLTATISAGTTTNSNNAAVAQILLGTLAGSTNPQIVQIQNNLLNPATTKAAFNNDLEATLPTVDGGNMVAAIDMTDATLDISDERLASVRNDNETGMAAGDMTNGMGAWIKGFGQHASQNDRNDVKGYDANTWGGALGLDTASVLDHGLIGIDFAYGRSDVNSRNANSADTNIDSYQATLYGTKDLGQNMFINGSVVYAWDRNTTVRNNVGGVSGLTADGKYNANQWAARLATGRDYVWEGMTLTPSLVGDYLNFHPQSYTETGAGGADLNVNYGNFNQLDLGGSLKAGWTIKDANGGVTKPDLHVGYRYNVLNDNVQATSSFTAGGGTFTTDGITPGRSIFNAGADIKFVATTNWDLFASYDFEAKSGYTANSGIVRAGYKF